MASLDCAAFPVSPRCSPLDLVRLWCGHRDRSCVRQRLLGGDEVSVVLGLGRRLVVSAGTDAMFGRLGRGLTVRLSAVWMCSRVRTVGRGVEFCPDVLRPVWRIAKMRACVVAEIAGGPADGCEEQ